MIERSARIVCQNNGIFLPASSITLPPHHVLRLDRYSVEAHETTPVLHFQTVNNLLCYHVLSGQIIGIRQRFIFQPANIQAELVALDQFLIIKGTPATAYTLSIWERAGVKGAAFLLPFPRHSGFRAGIHFWTPCGCTVMPVLRVVAFHEFIQIRSFNGFVLRVKCILVRRS